MHSHEERDTVAAGSAPAGRPRENFVTEAARRDEVVGC
jgi:hypothetical protein